MMKYGILDEITRGRFLELEGIYAEIEEAQGLFRGEAARAGNPVSCPPGCGTCCSNFKPDLLEIEADLVAFHLLNEGGEALARFTAASAAGDSPACPFQDKGRADGNCTIYPVRPLICRLFGFSSVRDKVGRPGFSLCKHMPNLAGTSARRFTGSQSLIENFGALPPVMSDYSVKATAMDPRSDGVSATIADAVGAALDRIGLLLRYSRPGDAVG